MLKLSVGSNDAGFLYLENITVANYSNLIKPCAKKGGFSDTYLYSYTGPKSLSELNDVASLTYGKHETQKSIGFCPV